MVSAAATRYARALAEVVLTQGSGLEAVSVAEQLKRVQELLASTPDLRHVLNSPAVASSKKRGVIGQLAGGLALDNKVRNFLYVVSDHHRIHQISDIREAFEAAMDRELGVVRAEVTSAQPLDEAQRNTVKSRFENMTGKIIRPAYAVDESLIGGIVTRVGSTVYDGSVRGQLDGLRRKLITES